MKPSASITVTISVMILLGIALALLAFFLWHQYSAMKMTQETQTQETSESVKTRYTLPLPQNQKPTFDSSTKKVDGTLESKATLTIGETLTIPQEKVAVLFSDVVFDSRCPENADCMVAGEGIVEAVVKIGDEIKTVYLSTWSGGKSDYWTNWKPKEGELDSKTEAEIVKMQTIAKNTDYVTGATRIDGGALIDGYVIGLRELTPGRHNDIDTGTPLIPKNEYKATFVVTRAITAS